MVLKKEKCRGAKVRSAERAEALSFTGGKSRMPYKDLMSGLLRHSMSKLNH
jgi:hypothetical protein